MSPKKPCTIIIYTQMSKLVQEVGSSRSTCGMQRITMTLSHMSNIPIDIHKF